MYKATKVKELESMKLVELMHAIHKCGEPDECWILLDEMVNRVINAQVDAKFYKKKYEELKNADK